MVTATPTRLGRYQILDEIGKGAMGVVYLAKDPLIGRLVALKTFHVGYGIGDDELRRFRERFMREAQSAGILSHPHIVTIHDAVEESLEGATFIAMEYVRGTNLKDLLARDEPLELPRIVDLVWQIADALDYAHSKGVVHRDIKPANIILTGDGQVKITDFGIARINTSNLTQEGQLLGTPNYMAPEQIQGREVDHRADIFSLGVLVYEMLTRHKPFGGENLTQVTHRVVHEDPTPPERYVGSLPEGLADLLSKALAKVPEERYGRAGELAEGLREIGERAAAQAELNETQEVAPPPLPQTPSLGSRLAGLGAGLGRRVASVLPEGQRPPLKRLAVVTLLAVAIVGGGGWALLGWMERSGLPSARAEATPVSVAESPEILPLLRLGHKHLRAGEPEAAAVAFAKAERLAPDSQDIRELRWEAERQAERLATAALRDEEVEAALGRGESALAGERYAAAATAAGRVLEIQPDNAAARDLLNRAEAAQERLRQIQEARTRSAAEEPPAPVPVAERPAVGAGAADPAPAPSPVVAEEAFLRVSFHTEVPEGVLMVYAGEAQLLRESFRFFEKSGLFRSRPVPGDLEQTFEVPTGEASLRIYLVIGGETVTRRIDGNFPGGTTRELAIEVSGEGALSASLR